eukprot:235785-Rhodomonas_salina.1
MGETAEGKIPQSWSSFTIRTQRGAHIAIARINLRSGLLKLGDCLKVAVLGGKVERSEIERLIRNLRRHRATLSSEWTRRSLCVQGPGATCYVGGG